jgi:hypothetical protein
MIVFDLRCVKDRRFEGWSARNEEVKRQPAATQVSCFSCDDTRIEKALTPVAIKRRPSSLSNRESPLQAWPQLCRQTRRVTRTAGEEILKEEGVFLAKIPVPSQPDN